MTGMSFSLAGIKQVFHLGSEQLPPRTVPAWCQYLLALYLSDTVFLVLTLAHRELSLLPGRKQHVSGTVQTYFTQNVSAKPPSHNVMPRGSTLPLARGQRQGQKAEGGRSRVLMLDLQGAQVVKFCTEGGERNGLLGPPHHSCARKSNCILPSSR